MTNVDTTANLDYATEDVRQATRLILDAVVNSVDPTQKDVLSGVEIALGAMLKFETMPAAHVIARAFHRSGVFDRNRLAHAIDHASTAFWTQFAACYPEISTGDLDALTDSTLYGAMHAAARGWLEANS